jgi:molybdopterin synthase catalytic subunit
MSTNEPSTYHPDIPSSPVARITDTIHVELTPHDLDSLAATRFVRSPSAGATVLFIGTTRDSFDNKPVSSLAYTSYAPLAISTLFKIGTGTSFRSPSSLLVLTRTSAEILAKHSCTKIAIIHKLGECPIGEESIVIAVSAPHRKAAWLAGEEALEMTKDRAEIWKLERFEGGEGVWRANRDGAVGVKVEE